MFVAVTMGLCDNPAVRFYLSYELHQHVSIRAPALLIPSQPPADRREPPQGPKEIPPGPQFEAHGSHIARLANERGYLVAEDPRITRTDHMPTMKAVPRCIRDQ